MENVSGACTSFITLNLALLAIFAFTMINIAGLHFGIRLQNFLSSFKVLAILAISGFIFWFTKSNVSDPAGFQFSGINFREAPGFAAALIAILWTYGGWHESTFMSGEFKDTKRVIFLRIKPYDHRQPSHNRSATPCL